MKERKLKAMIEVELDMENDESIEEADDRLYDLLYDGLCRDKTEVDFFILRTKMEAL